MKVRDCEERPNASKCVIAGIGVKPLRAGQLLNNCHELDKAEWKGKNEHLKHCFNENGKKIHLIPVKS